MYRNLDIQLRDDGKLQIRDIHDPVDLWLATVRFFNERRKVLVSAKGWKYPETTNRDVRQLAEVWSRVHAKIWRRDLARAKQHKDEWKEAKSAVEVATTGADPDAVFADNERFWMRWTKRQAIYLSGVREMPSKWDMLVESVQDSVKRLPGTLRDAAVDVAEATGSAAYTAGGVVAAPVRGLFSGLLGRPLLIGAAVIGGIVIVPKLLEWRRSTAPAAGSTTTGEATR